MTARHETEVFRWSEGIGWQCFTCGQEVPGGYLSIAAAEVDANAHEAEA